MSVKNVSPRTFQTKKHASCQGLASKTEASVMVQVSRRTVADPPKCFTANSHIKLNKEYLGLMMPKLPKSHQNGLGLCLVYYCLHIV